jgi:hypothetical protein
MQIGFDFGDTGAVKEVRPSPVWKPARPSLREWGRLLDDAKRAVQLLPTLNAQSSRLASRRPGRTGGTRSSAR